MASFHIFETAPYRQDEAKGTFSCFMKKLSSLNYFHLFERGDELLNGCCGLDTVEYVHEKGIARERERERETTEAFFPFQTSTRHAHEFPL